MPEDQNAKQPHWSDIQARQRWHTPVIPADTIVIHRGQTGVVHAFNSSTREEYKMGGGRSHAQSQSEDSWR